MKVQANLRADVLIIGGGAAGTRAALAAAEEGSRVILVNKGPLARSGITLTAGGGLQAPFHPDDSSEQYFEDIVKYGYYLADQNLAWAVATDARQCVIDLERYGVRFRKNPDGTFDQNKFPGQTHPRNVVFFGGGIGLMKPLKDSCLAEPGITVLEDFVVTGLVKGPGSQGGIAGSVGIDLKSGNMTMIHAGATVVATGGCQWLWKVNDCPADSTGDGLSMAYRTGAKFVDMEMILFYPSVIVWPPAAQGAFCHYEFLEPFLLDGEILDKSGNSVLPKPMPVRDKAMRLMFEAIEEGRGSEHGGLYWYVAESPKGMEAVKKYLNTPQYNYIRRQGIDPSTDKIEVAPGAHYQLGGVFIDDHCNTTVPGLFAIPECGGNFEGANRLSGSALSGTQVFGARAGVSAHKWSKSGKGMDVDPASLEAEVARVAARVGGCAVPGEAEAKAIRLRGQLREAAQRCLGIRREPGELKEFMGLAAGMKQELGKVRVADLGVFNQPLLDVLELDAMLEVGVLIAGSAMAREESRGHHFRTDFPDRDDGKWLQHTTAVQGSDGQPVFGTGSVLVTKIPLPR